MRKWPGDIPWRQTFAWWPIRYTHKVDGWRIPPGAQGRLKWLCFVDTAKLPWPLERGYKPTGGNDDR